ncbi:hypothetical protein SNOG_02033 [Parastagonospora nodorum SN15]|uniref:Uncharacterized protein n=1 Tax=Phaeosphaeria nodorum (strain SN15 / ATCC MYA-4574 / FGSC 10173) TaxID=321614 RepID=Q0V1T1_PHANO|nr:hypothetical protein SNOG_02033 [Parastagonospora nodorum SN15]EAT90245.1 hypothetical protein SNOG_02033 [Parastagonospora nodorum SN15]
MWRRARDETCLPAVVGPAHAGEDDIAQHVSTLS